MTAELKKKVIMSKELFEAPVGAFFQSLGWELVDAVDEETLKTCEFILNDYLPEINNFPRIKTDPAFSFSAEIEKCIRGVLDEKHIENENVKALLKAQFDAGAEYDFIERYSKNLKQVFMLKIHDYLNVGYFIDTMVIEAYKAKFDQDLIRSYLNDFIIYCLKQVEYNEDQRFIEVSYAFNDQAFAVQIHLEKQKFDLSFESGKLETYIGKANYFDINYFSKRKRLTLSSLWFKDVTLKKFHAHFYNETNSRVIEAPTLEVKSGLEPKEAITFIPADRDQGKKLALARKIALFIKNYRNNEETSKPSNELVVSDVEQYMTYYPRQEALAEVDGEIKQFILKLLKDENLYEGISDVIKKISDSGLEDYSLEIQKILSGTSLSDIEEALKISGGKEDLSEGFTRVQGQVEAPDDHQEVIKGVSQDLSNNEIWEIKRSQISEKIKEEVTRIKSEGRNVQQNDIVKIVSKQLDAPEEDVQIIVSSIVEEAIAPTVARSEVVADALASSIEEASESYYQREKNKLTDAQIQRMKKVMSQMRVEMLRLREENKRYTLNEENNPLVSQDNAQMKAALAKAMNVLKGKEKVLEKLKHDQEAIVNSKNRRLAALEARIEEMKTQHAHSPDTVNAEKLAMLEDENKNLKVKLDLANSKISTINGNIDHKEKIQLVQKDKELSTLKTSITMAQSLIEKFKSEKVDLELKLITEKEVNKKARDDFEAKLKNLSVADTSKYVDEIHTLTTDKKHLEEKSKLQSVELKKLEQKLKYSNSQLESAQKKKNSGSGSPKSNEAHLKQLESTKQQLTDATLEVAEKKKEALKLKQENTVLHGRIAELERKLGIADKKAS